MSRSRWFYAIEYAYKRRDVNNGRRPDRIHRFDTLAARGRFLLENDDIDGRSDLLTSTDPRVRKALRYAAQGMDWPQAVV